MSVNDGQPVNQAITNAAYVSRTDTTTSTASILQLLNSDTASGPTIANAQAGINSSIFTVPASFTIAAAGSIALDEELGTHLLLVSGSGGAITLSSTPFGAAFAGVNGTLAKIIGIDDANTVGLNHSDTTDGAVLNGNVILGRFDALTLQWSSELDRWLEISRNF